MTLATAFETIWREARNSSLKDEFYDKVKKETTYIKKMFKIEPVECVILAMLIDSDSTMNRREMAHFLDCSMLKMLVCHENFERLRRKQMIFTSYSTEMQCTQSSYGLCKGVVEAVRDNMEFVPRDPSTYTALEVMREIHRWLCYTDCNTEFYGQMVEEIKNMIDRTQHLELSRQLKSLPLSTAERVMFLIAATALIFLRSQSISEPQYEDILEESCESYEICIGINEGTGALARLNLMENAMRDGMAEPDEFKLTEKALKTVLKEFHINVVTMKPATPDNLLLPEKLTRKELYYNAEEQRQVDRLMDLLSQKTFAEVQRRLKETGMRTGFCVLLHGVPGSGKTELVNQLSISTGRPVLVAQVSDLISKWVGDYEKHVKELFDQYESLVNRSPVCPILLFNECDAILGRRNEKGGDDAAEKMYHSVQNILLERMEKLNGIMICTSNMPGALDKAFERRFLFSIEFHKPGKDTKTKIWRAMMPEIDEQTAQSLAAKFDFSGGQIENVVRRQRVEYILYGRDATLDSLDRICSEEGYSRKQRGIGFGV